MRQANAFTGPSALKNLRLAPNGRAGATPHDSAPARQAWTRGIALARAGRDAQALPLFEKATALAPKVALYWLNRAGSERRLRRTAPAIDSARRAFDLERGNPIACQMLAELQRMNNRDAEALRTLRALDADTPRDTQHWLLEGAVLMALARVAGRGDGLSAGAGRQAGAHRGLSAARLRAGQSAPLQRSGGVLSHGHDPRARRTRRCGLRRALCGLGL